MSNTPSVAISIATHNRQVDLRNTLEHLALLDPLPDEIIIGADNCSDGTIEMVQKDFPHCRLLVSDSPRGSIATRDDIVDVSKSDIILSLDDDSYPVEKDFLKQMVDLFEMRPDVGLLTFPHRTEERPESLEATEFGRSQWVGSYPNSGAAFRRELYNQLPGYPLFFFHAYEEPDFALQLWNAGFKVLNYTEITVRHFWTKVERNEGRTHRRHARNEFLSILIRCPWWLIIFLAPYRWFKQLWYAITRGISWVWREPIWWKEAIALTPQALKIRKPIPFKSYWKWIMLIRHPIEVDLEGTDRAG